MDDIRTEEVSFTSEGLTLRGTLRVPAGADGSAVALTGPFTSVREQVTGLYADRLARAGLVTLAFDHRGFGASAGRRGHEDTQGKLADLRSAVSLLRSRSEVDAERIGLVGICLGGGYAVSAAATDPRVRAVAGIAGAYNSPAWFARDPAGYRAGLRGFIDSYDDFLPAVAPGGGEAAMAGDEPWSYYGTARSTAASWENRVTRGSLHALLTFDALGRAALLAETPLLIVHGRKDDYCSPELATRMHDETPGDREIVWLDAGQHIDLYDREPYVSQAVSATASFLRRTLRGAAVTGPPAAG
ncbi:alpha/beta hydrolase [Actinoplanes sp. ATCC 53533]|uniref:alpha/beta hydrolase n=1 Tax=Actinoplanes sp. ATCC 53533 TaxID=1288362 RepID=UPI000F7798F9|nr:alpha/beta hydrolase [Actinoplanes sp. ATCC 53533]RSM56657.1 alpha/beta hydrolase [Actinoplanes sp. ATCC 53533]